MVHLAKKEHCTGCGACAYICPKHCITMGEDGKGLVYPVIDETNCVSCKKCEKTCPILFPVEFHCPSHAYAAWSSDEEERRTSASGGIAAEIYKHSLGEGSFIAGAVQNEDFSVSLQMADNKEAIAKFKNSKYVFSSAYSLFPKIKDVIKQNHNLAVIGLPCQIAAIRKLFKDSEKLFLVDIVCHGTTPYNYLAQHIKTLESEFGQKATKMSFRDAEIGTDSYTFTLYNKDGQRFCMRKVSDGDAYQVGYHSKITYRENCYHCHFARNRRVGDLTIADYHGLGLCSPCSFSSENVSLILSNTEKGSALVKDLKAKNKIDIFERPLEEPFKGDIQLRHPSTKTLARFDFVRLYRGDFSKTMNIVLGH